MTTHILDFEEVLRNFEPYHVSLKSIQKEKKEFSELIDNIKKEMETILGSSKSLILDDSTNQKNQMRFKELQNKAVQAESEFRSNIVARQNEEVEKNFQQIMDIVQEYSIENSLDLVVNKSTIVYVNPNQETGQIQVQSFPYIFVEFLDKDNRDKNNWTFTKSSIVISDVVLDAAIINQYNNINSVRVPEPAAEPVPYNRVFE